MAHAIFRGLLGNSTGGGGGGSGSNGPDDYFDESGPSIDTAGTRYGGAYPWTLQNNTGGSTSVSGSALSITAPAVASFSPMLATEAMDAGDGAWRTQVAMSGSSANYRGLGLALRESGTNKQLCFGLGTDSGAIRAQVRRMTDYTTWTSNYGGTGVSDYNGYLEIIRDGTTLFFLTSEDESNWTELVRVAQTADFTTAPNQVGLWVASQSGFGVQDTGLCLYFVKHVRTVP
jgi:hypothetical protein